MFTAAWSNFILSGFADYIQRLFNSTHQVCVYRLFKNPVTVTPGTVLSDLYECDFPGYSSIPLTGITPPPIKLFDGYYSISLTVGPFVCEGTAQNAYGAYISSGSNLYLAETFPVPQSFVAGTIVNIPSQFVVASATVWP